MNALRPSDASDGNRAPACYGGVMSRAVFVVCCVLSLVGCRWSSSSGTEPPPDGWANSAPTRVEQVVNREQSQVLEVRQDQLTAWIEVPRVGARVGDYILLGAGTAREDVEIPEVGVRAPIVVDIKHARVVSLETAKRAVLAAAPKDAVKVGTIYAELDQRKDKAVVVYGTVVKSASAVGWNWVHIRDGTGGSVGRHP